MDAETLRTLPLLLGGTLVLVGAIACGRADGRDADASGRQLAERHCQTCHLLPDPGSLDRASWERWVLPRMGRRLGLEGLGGIEEDEPIEAGEAGPLVREAGVFPDTPRISYAEWAKLADYYRQGAPLALPPAPPRARIPVGVPGFRVRIPDFRIASPMVTLVRVDPARGRIYLGDATPGRSTLTVLDGRGRVMETLALPSAASHLHLSGDTLALLLMGRLHPSDAPLGSLGLLAPGRAGTGREITWRVDGLRRPVYASYADLSGDGVEDVVVSEFGHLSGRLAWYERRPGGGSRRHPITPVPGALNTFARDFDGDGRTDLMALIAQGDEGVSLFRRRPDGGFSQERLLRFPPSFGSTSMELRDLDHDGDWDILHTSGDAGDYPTRPRPYHGVRIFLNDGSWRFTESYFFPLHGAFKAVARDFDDDGDDDVAAIAFYPDYESGAPEPFVYLENLGGLRFRPSIFADADRGRWLTMDAGDVDRDGDDDLVLGSFAQPGMGETAAAASGRWRDPDAPSIVILENGRGEAAPDRESQ